MESANVVGYNNFGLRSDGAAIGVGSCFYNVDNTELTLGDLTVTGYTGEYMDFQVQAKELDGAGRGGTTYYWVDATVDGEKFYGWYNDDGSVCYNDLDLIPGEGLWVYSPSADFKVQSAGSVPESSITVTLRGNGAAKMVTNPMPSAMNLGDVEIKGYSGDYMDFQIQAKKLDGAGRGGTTYYWVDATVEGQTFYGWYNDDGSVDYNDVDVAAGEGLWIYSPSTSLYVEFPSPLAD